MNPRHHSLPEQMTMIDMAHIAARMGSWSASPHQNMLYWSEPMFVLFGRDHDDGQPSFADFFSLFDTQGAELLRSSIKSCVDESRAFQFTVLLGKNVQAKNEPDRWFRFNGLCTQDDNGKPQVYGLCQEITEQRVQERELKETRTILQSIFDHMPAVVYSKTRDGMFTFANPKFYEVCPGAAPSAIGRYGSDIFPPETAAEHRANDDEIIRTGKTLHSLEHVPQKDGSLAYFDSYKFPTFDDKGNIIGVTGISIDITEKKMMQDDLDRQRAMGLHQARLASIGELAAGVGHEINNPLTIVMSYLTQIENNLRVQDPTAADAEQSAAINLDMITKARKASDRIRSIVGGLRTFARSSADAKQNFPVIRAVSNAVNMVKEIYAKVGVDLSFQPPSEQVFCYGDEGQLQQVIMNLVSNARDAVTEAAQKVVKIEIEVQKATKSFLIQVSDTGAGISPALAARIFDPFFTTKDVTKGTGLGLSIAQSIIKDHGGEVSYERTSQGGSRFRILLPMAQGSATEVEAKSETSTPSANTTSIPNIAPSQTAKKVLARVLVADDEEDILEILCLVLRGMGFEVTGVSNGREAFAEIQKNHYDVLITDMNMPYLKGNELIRKIRTELQNKSLKIFIITGGINLNFEAQDSELRGLIDGHFYKPFDQKILKTSLFTTLGL